MTDHQQAAIEAAEKKIVQAITGFVREHKTISSEELTKDVLTAALPAIEKQQGEHDELHDKTDGRNSGVLRICNQG